MGNFCAFLAVMSEIKTIHYIHGVVEATVSAVDQPTGVSAMIITYIILTISGLIGSAIAVDEVKSATLQD